MATLISTFALVLAGQGAGEAQSILPRDHRNSDRTDARRDDRASQSCTDELREYARKNDEQQQRLHRQHGEWHRAHDRDTSDNSVRQHNELHVRLDRTRREWERTPKPVRCEAERSAERTRDGRAKRVVPEKKPGKRERGN